ncbi:peptide methionine sulfoxide reductase-like [Haliotis rufescens]|uniref:peptide methionine sulfoxide reductase-like n=1 Tax=Haliotis rufescens TaxID=6454 RepID=UPI00201F5D36|nr:peptide methionine sulfoxide reductase-like [Haliotis rufescens]XP_046361261.2 peptide methionine sulfoxide reductase-like [Haliotis rufescens]
MGDHTETVEVVFDPELTSFRALLGMFWKNHDPTSSHSRQYMSAIFYHDEEQRKMAELTMKEQQSSRARPIATVITKAKTFYNAEDYHQKYMLRHYPDLVQSLRLNNDEIITSAVAARLNGYLGGNGNLEQFDEECSTFGLSRSQMEVVRKKVNSRM